MFTGTETRVVVAREGKSSCLMSVGFQFCEMKKFWRLAANSVNIPHTTEHLEMVTVENAAMLLFPE